MEIGPATGEGVYWLQEPREDLETMAIETQVSQADRPSRQCSPLAMSS